MGIQVSRREVLTNLIRFKDSILEKESPPDIHVRNYSAFVQRHTGDVRFFPTWEESWVPIHITAEDAFPKVQFRLDHPKRLDPLAEKILVEMLDVLNQLAFLYAIGTELLPEREVLNHLEEVEVAPLSESIENFPGWAGRLSRIEAENKLRGYSPGEYLLRRGDPIHEGIAEAKAEANEMKVEVYVVTFVATGNKIAELLLLQTEKGWTICRDESDLRSPLYKYYTTLSALLESLRDKITTPI